MLGDALRCHQGEIMTEFGQFLDSHPCWSFFLVMLLYSIPLGIVAIRCSCRKEKS